MMKVLFVVNEKPDSGISVYSNMVAKELGKKIFVSIDNELSADYDLIHVHSARPDALVKIKSMHPYTSIVATTHVTSGEINGLVPDFLLSYIDAGLISFYRTCDKVFATSPHIFRQLEKDSSLKKKLVFLPNPVDVEKFSNPGKQHLVSFKKKFGIPFDKKIVLFVGSIQYRKGIFDFVETAKKMPEYSFVWVGKVPEIPYLKHADKIKKIVEKNNVKNLFFTGALFGKELASAYHASDLFWMPSFSETFGLVVVEAAACGKLILIRDLPIKEMFKEFIATYSGDAAEKISDMLENQKKYAHLKKEMKKAVLKFRLNQHASRLIEEYSKVIKEKGSNFCEKNNLRAGKKLDFGNKIIASIIVPTLNEEKNIEAVLNALNNQSVSRKNYEIIVSDSSSSDATVRRAKKVCNKVVVCERRSAGFGRTFGAKHAKGKYLGFVDADTIVSYSWVEGLIESLSKAVVCTGPFDNIEKDLIKINAYYLWWNLQTRGSTFFGRPIIPGFNFGVRAKDFWAAGGFPKINMVCEDMGLSLKLGKRGRAAFSEKMSVRTSARRQKEIPLHKHLLSGAKYFFTKKSFSWNEYRKDFGTK